MWNANQCLFLTAALFLLTTVEESQSEYCENQSCSCDRSQFLTSINSNNSLNGVQPSRPTTAPSRLFLPMKTEFRQVNSGGPPDPYPKSKHAMNLPQLTVYDSETDAILTDIKEGLQYVLQTNNDFTLALIGTAHTGCHAVLDGLIEPGDKVLVLTNGYWGEMMANVSERLDAQVIRYKNPFGQVFTLEEIQAALDKHHPDLVLVTLGESSAAIYQPLDGVGELCEKIGALLVVDVTAVIGIQPVLMDERKFDAVYSNSQKGIGASTGLAPVSLSSRAVMKLKNRQKSPRTYHTDLTMISEVWNTSNPNRFRFHTLSLPLLYSLREALSTIAEEKIENIWKRHEMASEQLYRGLEALELQYSVENSKDRLVGTTMVETPEGKDSRKIADHMLKNFNVEISTGFGPRMGTALRFGTTASNADKTRIIILLEALKESLTSMETNII